MKVPGKKIYVWTRDLPDPVSKPAFVTEVFFGVSTYVTAFLTAKHPFRRGSVCPFVALALKKNGIFYTYVDEERESDAIKRVLECMERYLELKFAAESNFSSMIILFRKEFPIRSLLKIQNDCKEACVNRNLMIGALYPKNPSPSLNSKTYFPLRTPSPVIVLRDLTAVDLLFLHTSRYSLKKRMTFLTAFIKRFGAVNSGTAWQQVEIAKRLMRTYRIRFFIGSAAVAGIFAVLGIGVSHAILK